MELVGTQLLEWWLEDSKNVKILWSPLKKMLVPTCMYGQLNSLVVKVRSLANALLDVSRVLNSKCPKLKASKD